MRKIALLAVVGVMLVFTVGCGAGMYMTPVQPPPGMLFADINGPISSNFDAGATVTMKKGTAMSEHILGLISTGDCSLSAAAANGNIRKIHYADYKFKNILGVYSKFTTVVYGE
jgi:hypothetical protein